MPMVKVIRHGQVTLPVVFRKELDIEEGDYLEAELHEDSIVLRPKMVMDQEEAVQALHRIMDKVQERTEDVDAETIEQEVAQAIREVRGQQRP